MIFWTERADSESPLRSTLAKLHTINLKKNGSMEESEVAGFFVFSHMRMKGYFRLG